MPQKSTKIYKDPVLVQMEMDSGSRKIETLVNSVQDAGSYRVGFDASRYASGVYLYQIKTKDFARTGKMLLVK